MSLLPKKGKPLSLSRRTEPHTLTSPAPPLPPSPLLPPCPLPSPQLMLMHIGQVWHYPGATAFTEIPHSGMPSWVPWCYFVYTSAVSQLTRFLKKTA